MSFFGPIELIVGGQSNGLGANGGVYAAPYANPDRSDIKAAKSTTIGAATVVEPWGNLRPNQQATNNWHGPDLPAAIDLVDDHGKAGLYVVMRAKGSTALAVEWAPVDSGVPGEDWRTLRDLVLTTRADHPTETANRRPWVVFVQGEQDASDATQAAAYAANLRESMRQWVRYFGPGTRFVIVYLHDNCTRTHRATVRAAQESVVAEWAGRAWGLDPTGICTVSGDGVHYGDQGLAVGQAIGTLIAGQPR